MLLIADVIMYLLCSAGDNVSEPPPPSVKRARTNYGRKQRRNFAFGPYRFCESLRQNGIGYYEVSCPFHSIDGGQRCSKELPFAEDESDMQDVICKLKLWAIEGSLLEVAQDGIMEHMQMKPASMEILDENMLAFLCPDIDDDRQLDTRLLGFGTSSSSNPMNIAASSSSRAVDKTAKEKRKAKGKATGKPKAKPKANPKAASKDENLFSGSSSSGREQCSGSSSSSSSSSSS